MDAEQNVHWFFSFFTRQRQLFIRRWETHEKSTFAKVGYRV